MRQAPATLETVWVEVPETALEAYEAALAPNCLTVGFFFADEERGIWRVEGVREAGDDAALRLALMLAEAISGAPAVLQRGDTQAEGWLARLAADFPEQQIGTRFAIRGTHLHGPRIPGRVTLVLDAALAFGSGEHGSTRGCLRALERVARRPVRGALLDVGTGTGILAMAAAKLLHRPVLGTDIEPMAVRVASGNARRNGVGGAVRLRVANGWRSQAIARGAPYGLVFANILARPLCLMARDLAAHLAPGGTAILAGLLNRQANMVLAAHRRQGLVLAGRIVEGNWTTLVVRRRG
jgi:ribosomal protein L11 methyltransferase